MQIYKNLLLSAFVAALFIGCGEGFQAKKLSGEAEGTQTRETSEEVDAEIVQEIAPEGVSQEPLNIGAFQVIKEVRSSGQSSHPGGAVDSVYNIRVEMRGQGCDGRRLMRQQTGIGMDEMLPPRGITFGDSNGTRITLVCTRAACNEMTGIVREGDRTNVLYLFSNGLEPVGVEGSRTIMGRNYRTQRAHGFGVVVPSVGQFDASCAGDINTFNEFENGSQTQGSTQGQTINVDPNIFGNGGSFNGFENDGSTSDTVIDPTGDQNSGSGSFNGFENDGSVQNQQNGWDSEFNGTL